jgi:hypothetical protein
MSMPSISRSREAEAFFDARQHVAPEVVSACEGWTAHEVTTHLAAAAAEIIRHLQPYLNGEPVPKTRTFEEREPPFRALDDTALCRRLATEERTMRAVLEEVLAREPDAVIPWTGRQMAVAKFVLHLRNEFVIHRWDFVGDDQVSAELLAQPELTEHAVDLLGQLLLRRGREHDPCPDENFHVRLRTENAPDVRLVVEAGQAGLELVSDQTDEPHVNLDPAARTLVIWGRRPDQRGRFRSHVSPPTLRRLHVLLSGY